MFLLLLSSGAGERHECGEGTKARILELLSLPQVEIISRENQFSTLTYTCVTSVKTKEEELPEKVHLCKKIA